MNVDRNNGIETNVFALSPPDVGEFRVSTMEDFPQMDHSEAVRNQAADKYVLGQMTLSERCTFEAHYFDCALCADEVELGFAFADSARSAFRKPVVVEAQPGWLQKLFAGFLQPAPALVMAGLALVAGYQSFVHVPALSQELATWSEPHGVASYESRMAERAGTAESIVAIPSKQGPAVVNFYANGAKVGMDYQFEILSGGKRLWGKRTVRPMDDAGLFSIGFDSRTFTPGVYAIRVANPDGRPWEQRFKIIKDE